MKVEKSEAAREEVFIAMPTGALSFAIFHADGSRTSLVGLPLIRPTVISFVAANGPPYDASLELSQALVSFLLSLSPKIQLSTSGCSHGSTGIDSCAVCSDPLGIQLLVVSATSSPPAFPSVPHPSWWTGGTANRKVLPIFRIKEHPTHALPQDFQKFNAAFWQESGEELVTTVLSAAGLTPESHRIFISYRRLETELLAEDLFASLNRFGFDVFLDRFAIPPAVDFQRRLHHDLGTKSMVLLLESDRFGESNWTTEEVTFCKRNDLGLFALRLPHGADPAEPTRKLADVPDEWRLDLACRDFASPPEDKDGFMQWGALEESVRDKVVDEVRVRHDAAILRRRLDLRTQMLTELGRAGALDLAMRADGLIVAKSKTSTPYAIWITPRPPELQDFHATHSACQFPYCTVGVIVGLTNLFEPEVLRRMEWLSGVCRLVLVDPGHIVTVSAQIAEGTL